MQEQTRQPSQPGEILKKLYLDPLQLSIADFAKHIGVSRKTVSDIINGRTAISTDMALRLSRALDTTPNLWLNLQQQIDLWNAKNTQSNWLNVQPIRVTA